MIGKILNKTTSFIAVLLIAASILVPVQAFAFDAFEKTCDGSTEATQSAVCQEKIRGRDPVSGTEAIIPRIANIIAIIGGIIAVIIIMISGLRMITSSGDSKKLTESRNAIIYAAAGILVIISARLIIALILRSV